MKLNPWLQLAITVITLVTLLSGIIWKWGGSMLASTTEFRDLKSQVATHEARLDTLDARQTSHTFDLKIHQVMGPPEGHGAKP